MLLGTGLMVRDYRELATEGLGFTTEGTLHGQVRLPLRLWDTVRERVDSAPIIRGSPELAEMRRVLKERLAAHPAAGRVSLAKGAPLVPGGYGWTNWFVEGEDRSFANNEVDPSFFQLLGRRLLRGRFLNDEDGREDAPAVSVVSDAFANLIWPGEDALGKQFDGEVVGVVASIRESGYRQLDRTVYTPLNRAYGPTTASYRGPTLSFFIETEDPEAVQKHARAVLAQVLPGVPMTQSGPLEDVAASWLRERFAVRC